MTDNDVPAPYIRTQDRMPEPDALVVSRPGFPVTVGSVIIKFVALYGHTTWRPATEAEVEQYREMERFYEENKRYPE